MPESLAADLLLDCRNFLGEGIQWHGGTERLFWTDIEGRSLWCCDEDGGSVETVEMPERVGSFAFTEDGNRLLMALESGLALFDPETGDLLRLGDIEPDQKTTRLNDGRCDRDGRFVFGGMDEQDRRPISAVYRYGGGDRLHKLIDGVGCTNSIAFSPDGNHMYVADSPTRTIRRYEYPDGDAPLGEAVEFATLQDGDGHRRLLRRRRGPLWNARFRGGAVQAYKTDGSLGQR